MRTKLESILTIIVCAAMLGGVRLDCKWNDTANELSVKP